LFSTRSLSSPRIKAQIKKDKKGREGFAPMQTRERPRFSKSIEQGTQEKATSGGEKAFSQPDSGKSYGRSDSNKAF
jgi:hypothetical protein